MTRDKLKKIWSWLRKNALNKEMFLYLLFAELIFWSPLIVMIFMAIFVNSWYWSVVGGIFVFWANPITPGWAIQIALALLLKKILKGKRK